MVPATALESRVAGDTVGDYTHLCGGMRCGGRNDPAKHMILAGDRAAGGSAARRTLVIRALMSARMSRVPATVMIMMVSGTRFAAEPGLRMQDAVRRLAVG